MTGKIYYLKIGEWIFYKFGYRYELPNEYEYKWTPLY